MTGLVLIALWLLTAGAGEAQASTISGWVTNEQTGGGIAGACVDAYNTQGDLQSPDRSTVADGAGYYLLEGLDPTDYYVTFYSCDTVGEYDGYYFWEAFDDDPTGQNPTPVDAAPDPTGINAALEPAGLISGTVTFGRGGQEDICVDVYDDEQRVSSARTGPGGTYVAGGLDTGTYLVKFFDCGTGQLATEWYSDAVQRADAQAVSVVRGEETSGINAAMNWAVQISGRVTAEDGGTPIENVCVSVLEPDGDFVSSGSTDVDGNYAVGDVRADRSYKVEFDDCYLGNYIDEFYDDKSTLAAADPVVVAFENVTGIDAQLATGGKITGQLIGEGGGNVEMACITAWDSDGNPIGHDMLESTDDFNYEIRGLPTGSYRLGFEDCGPGEYLPEFYDNKSTLATANPIAVTAGQTTSGINATLRRAGAISGTVSVPSSTSPDTVCVRLYNAAGALVNQTVPEPGGEYRFPGLVPGSYRVGFFDCVSGTLQTEYYNNKATLSAANPIAVSGGSDADVDAALVAKPPPDGQVTNPTATAPEKQKQRGKRVKVKFTAGAGEAVKVTGDGQVKLGKKRIPLIPKSAQVAAGKTQDLVLTVKKRPGKKILRALKRGKKATATITVLFEDARGNTATRVLSVKLFR